MLSASRPLLLAAAAAALFTLPHCLSPDSAPGSGGEVLQCGDERVDLDSLSQPVVNGSTDWDPDVVALDSAQRLAVGAIMMTTGGGFTNICTGTLVSPGVVLTAAHCVRGRRGSTTPARSLRFGIGADVSRPDELLEVAAVHAHPSYSGRSAEHDICVLELTAAAAARIKSIHPIPHNCAPLDAGTLVGAQVQTGGYGATDLYGRARNSRQLWAVQEVVDLTGFDYIVDGHGESGVCYGDSGGPTLTTMADGTVRTIGCLSWGDQLCAHQDHFVRTDTECDFINRYVPVCGGETEEGRCDGSVAVYCLDEVVTRQDCSGLESSLCGDDEAGHKRCVHDPCEGETEAGRCEGDEAVFCLAGEVVRERCTDSAQVCRADAAGLHRCVPDPCAGETERGRCAGAVAIYCADDTVVRTDCAADRALCGLDDSGASRCVPDPCEGETVQGRCASAVAVYCVDGTVRRDECAPPEQICADDASGQQRCVPDPCRGETLLGRCDGDDAVWCEAGQVRRRRCADCGQSCGESPTLGAVYCVTVEE